MKPFLAALGSLRLTLAAMLLLVGTALAGYRNPDISLDWVTLPLALLGLNLLSVIFINKRFRQQHGLLVFHLGLLAIIVLTGIGLMTRLSARVELVEGQSFDPAEVVTIKQGPWHPLQLDEVHLVQGPVRVDYLSGLLRDETQSRIWTGRDADPMDSRMVTTREPFKAAGYRFQPTANKGYAVILTWTGVDGQTDTGAVHMDSFPLYEWKQENDWVTPQGEKLTLQLQQPSPVQADGPWSLQSSDLSASQLVIHRGNQSIPLERGGSVQVQGGQLQFEDVRLWLGYSIEYNVTLLWQFVAAIIAITGLAVHFLQKFAQVPLSDPARTARGPKHRSTLHA